MTARRTTQAKAVESFAAELSALRESAGRPSFRRMAGRSSAISHTTLHEASQGHRLPSWETTVEYVRACGGEPDDYRCRWEAARRACAPAQRALPRPTPVVPGAEADHQPDPDPAVPSEPGERADPWTTGRRPLLALGTVAAVLAVVVGLDAAAHFSDTGTRVLAPAAAVPGAGSGGTPTGCPGDPMPRATSTAAAHDGDAMALVADVTLPACTGVPAAVERTKTWRVRNAGTRTWQGYTLRRLDLPQHLDGCQSITEVPVARTAPGGTVDVSIRVTMPRRPTACLVRYELADADGQPAFPGSLLFLQVRVG